MVPNPYETETNGMAGQQATDPGVPPHPPHPETVVLGVDEGSATTIIRQRLEDHRTQALTADLPKGRASVSLRHRAICHMAALGIKTNKIAQTMALSAPRVSAILNSPEARELVKEIQAEFFTAEPQAVFRSMAPKAARVIYRIMGNSEEKGSTRLAAASAILDRAYGKPQQEIKHEGSLVKELFAQLDHERKTINTVSREVTDAEVVEDEVDKWCKENGV